jgi:hypothetical protein
MIKPFCVDPLAATPRWEFTGPDAGVPFIMPPLKRLLVQVSGDLMGGTVAIAGSVVTTGDADAQVERIRSPGIYEIVPVRTLAPSFDGPEGAAITVTIAGIP